MAPTTQTSPSIMARSTSMSGGAIAGAVVGSIFGFGWLALILGFVYFRIKRKLRESSIESGKESPSHEPAATTRRASFSGPGYSAHPYVPPFPGDELTTKEHEEHPTIDTSQAVENLHQTRLAPPHGENAINGEPPQSPDTGPSLAVKMADSSRDSMGIPSAQTDTGGQHGHGTETENPEPANASYYDTRISLDSEPPAAGPGSPTPEMNKMYEEQIKESRERNKKKQSTSSVKRFLDTIRKGRQSTYSSTDGSRGVDTPAWTASAQGSRSGTGLESVKGVEMQNAQHLSFPGSRQIFDEPEEIGDFVGPGVGAGAGGYAQVPSGRSPIDAVPQTRARRVGNEAQQLARINSWRKDSSRIRDTTEVDPELPSAVYGSRFGSSDSYYGGGFPHSAAPPAAQPPHSGRQEPLVERPHDIERLKSPEIPEPIYDDESNGMLTGPQNIATSSPSPPLSSENFVRPMHVMQPTTSTEKYYHTDYRLENPISPVEGPAMSSPEMTTSPEMHHISSQNYVLSTGQIGVDPMDEFLDIPGYDEPRRSSESYDYSVSMGPSSTDPSSGRTPDTRITMSPSPLPMPYHHQQTPYTQQYQQQYNHLSPSNNGDFNSGSSASPEPTRLSPNHAPGSLMCDECGRTFDQIHKLNHHKRYHDRKHECPYQECDKKFGTKTHLDRHINDKHLKSKAFHCTEPGCAYFKGGKAFPRKDNWRRHMVKKHGANQQTFDAMDEGMD